MSKANEKVVTTGAVVLAAGIILLSILLFISGVIAKPIDTSDCLPPLASIEYDVKKFENEGTLLAEGWAVDTENSYNTFNTTVVLKDLVTGRFYRLPTATRSEDWTKIGIGGEDMFDKYKDKEGFAGFFSRGILPGGSGNYALYLLFDSGSARYLIDTEITA